VNKIIFIGNLTQDPESGITQSGTKYCRFTIAVGRSFDKEKTDFFSCTAWEKKAEVIEKYVKKGNKLSVVGRLEINEGEKDGVKTKYYSVIVEDIEFLTPKSDTVPHEKESNMKPIEDGDLPF